MIRRMGVPAIVGVGAVLLLVTFFGFYFAYKATAPTEADISTCVATNDAQCMQRVTAASERAGSIRNTSYFVMVVEIIGVLGATVLVARRKSAQG